MSDRQTQPVGITMAELLESRRNEARGAIVADKVLGEIRVAFDAGSAADRDAAIETLDSLPVVVVQSWFDAEVAAATPDDVPEFVRLAAAAAHIDVGVDLSRAVLELDRSTRVVLGSKIAESASFAGHIERLQRSERLDHRRMGLELAELTGDGPAILRGFDDPSADVRRAAVELADPHGDADLGVRLGRLAVEDPSVEVRLTAARRLVDVEGPARVDAIRQALGSPDAAVRAMAVGLLGSGGVDEVVALAGALDDESSDVAAAAAALLARSHPSEAAGILWPALVESDGPHRAAVLGAFDELELPSIAATLHRAMRSDDPVERALGHEVAARRDRSDAMTLQLHEALTDPSIDVRLHALDALGSRVDALDVDALAGRLQDPAPAVRLAAVRLLRALADDRSFGPLLSAAGDPVDHVRAVAREAVLDRRGPGLVDDLVAALSEPSRRRTARELLVELDADAIDGLLEALGTADSEVRAEIGSVLHAAGHGDELVRRLQSRDPNVRLEALLGIEALVDPSCVPVVSECLIDPVTTVRGRAAEVLATLGDPRAIEPLRRAMMSDPDLDLVPGIESALRSLGADELDDDVIELRPEMPVET